MKVQADKHQNPAPDYKVSQQVWLSMDNLRMLNRTSKKLTEKWIGPYEVTRVTPNAVELKLPKSLRIHLVVCNEPVSKSVGRYSFTPEYRTRCSTCSAVCFQFNQGTIDLCFLSVSLPARLPQCS